MGAWNKTNAASKKELVLFQRTTFGMLHEMIADILTQQQKLGERLDRKLGAIHTTQKQLNEDIITLKKTVEAMEEFICFAMANKLIDSLEQAVEHAPVEKKRKRA